MFVWCRHKHLNIRAFINCYFTDIYDINLYILISFVNHGVIASVILFKNVIFIFYLNLKLYNNVLQNVNIVVYKFNLFLIIF